MQGREIIRAGSGKKYRSLGENIAPQGDKDTQFGQKKKQSRREERTFFRWRTRERGRDYTGREGVEQLNSRKKDQSGRGKDRFLSAGKKIIDYGTGGGAT